jgi:peptidoglycan/LPS O-acetylase OafA/YrhL
MRAIAALSVMWTHAPLIGTHWGNIWKHVAGAMRFGVPFFTIAALILLNRSIAKRPEEPVGVYAKGRFARLVPPLIVWSVIYIVFYAVMRHFGGGKQVPIGPGLLLGGAAIHLWFLPFILIACVLAFPLLKAVRAKPGLKPIVAFTLCLAAAGAVFLPNRFPPERYGGIDAGALFFFEQAIWNLPTFFAGIAIAMYYPQSLTARQSFIASLVGMVIVVAAAVLAYKRVSSSGIQLAKGFGISLIALSTWSPWFVRKLAWFGRLSFGVYLVHLLYVSLFRDMGGWWFDIRHVAFYPVVTLLAFVASYATAVLANRVAWAKFLFP